MKNKEWEESRDEKKEVRKRENERKWRIRGKIKKKKGNKAKKEKRYKQLWMRREQIRARKK